MSASTRLLIVGAGGHGKVVAETALASGRWKEVAFLDGRYPQLSSAIGWPVVGSDAEPAGFLNDHPEAFVAIGDNQIRVSRILALQALGFRVPALVHPAAWVSPSAILGAGSVVMAGGIINACADLGRGCIVNTGATVDHDCVLADGVHISPGAHVGGASAIGERSWVGVGAAIRHGVRIGADVMIGAGAAVVGDLPSGVTAIGVPARIT